MREREAEVNLFQPFAFVLKYSSTVENEQFFADYQMFAVPDGIQKYSKARLVSISYKFYCSNIMTTLLRFFHEKTGERGRRKIKLNSISLKQIRFNLVYIKSLRSVCILQSYLSLLKNEILKRFHRDWK